MTDLTDLQKGRPGTYDQRGSTRQMNQHGRRKLERIGLERRKHPVTGMMGIYAAFDPNQQPDMAKKLSSVGKVEKKPKPNQPLGDDGRCAALGASR